MRKGLMKGKSDGRREGWKKEVMEERSDGKVE